MIKYKNVSELEGDSQEVLNALKAGNGGILKQMYFLYRTDFIVWLCRKTSCKEDMALDIFHQSLMALHYNIVNDKISKFEKSIRAYLFGIGKNKYLQIIRKKQPETLSYDGFDDFEEDLAVLPDEACLKKEQRKNILGLLRKMREPCYSILYLFYYENRSLADIAIQLNYLNDKVAKTQKARCMNKLRIAAKKIEHKLR